MPSYEKWQTQDSLGNIVRHDTKTLAQQHMADIQKNAPIALYKVTETVTLHAVYGANFTPIPTAPNPAIPTQQSTLNQNHAKGN